VVAKNNEENGESERSENVALVLPPSSGSLSGFVILFIFFHFL
jgi:hypothetical protein